MQENYLSLEKSPLVNIRRAIKRSNQKRQVHLFHDSNKIRISLKQQHRKPNYRYSTFEKSSSPDIQIRLSHNPFILKQSLEFSEGKSGEGFLTQFQEEKIMRIHKRDKEFRVKRHNNSQTRCKSDFSFADRENQQIDLRSNLTVFNLVPKYFFSEKKALKKLSTFQSIQQNSMAGSHTTSNEKGLRLKFPPPLLSNSKSKTKERKFSRSKLQFCPWNSDCNGENQQNIGDHFFD